MTNVFWTDYAKASLQLTMDFLEIKWGNQLKEELIDLIDARINQVVLNPNIAPFLEGTEYKRLLIHKHLTVFYTIISNGIKIILVWDNRQNPYTLVEELSKIR